jgi:hypothetical protein
LHYSFKSFKLRQKNRQLKSYKLQFFALFVQVIKIETKKSTVNKLQVASLCIICSSHSNWDEKIDSLQVTSLCIIRSSHSNWDEKIDSLQVTSYKCLHHSFKSFKLRRKNRQWTS